MTFQDKSALILFETPSSFILCGATNTGKTFFVKRLLENANFMFKEPPLYILYCYGSVWQNIYDDMLKHIKHLTFHEGLPSKAELIDIHKDVNGGHFICIFDDLMSETSNNVSIEHLVCVGSHHLNMTIICLVQNLFQKGKIMRTLSLNTHYFILYKNRRDQEQIQRFGRQIFPQQSKYFMDAYQKGTSFPYGYLLVDLNPHSSKLYQLRTKIFPGEDMIIYRPSDEEFDIKK